MNMSPTANMQQDKKKLIDSPRVGVQDCLWKLEDWCQFLTMQSPFNA